jgi:hypothetical protein
LRGLGRHGYRVSGSRGLALGRSTSRITTKSVPSFAIRSGRIPPLARVLPRLHEQLRPGGPVPHALVASAGTPVPSRRPHRCPALRTDPRHALERSAQPCRELGDDAPGTAAVRYSRQPPLSPGLSGRRLRALLTSIRHGDCVPCSRASSRNATAGPAYEHPGPEPPIWLRARAVDCGNGRRRTRLFSAAPGAPAKGSSGAVLSATPVARRGAASKTSLP